MNDEQYTPALGSWLKDTDITPPDPYASARQIMTGLPEREKRRNWWPFHRHTTPIAPPTTDQTIEYQPAPIPATNGHTPTVLGRTKSMFSPVKAITAGALVFALGGVLLIAQPFDQQGGSVPGAATDAEPILPVEVIGQMRLFEGGVERWTTDDARLTGDARWDPAEGSYRDPAPSYFLNGWLLETDEGSWRPLPIPVVILPDQERPEGCSVPVHCLGGLTDFDLVLIGEGGYEGLTFIARATWTVNGERGFDVHGFIIEGEVPSAPEPWSAE